MSDSSFNRLMQFDRSGYSMQSRSYQPLESHPTSKSLKREKKDAGEAKELQHSDTLDIIKFHDPSISHPHRFKIFGYTSDVFLYKPKRQIAINIQGGGKNDHTIDDSIYPARD